jgi:8-oxo-dGTP pyrophosphatase MutT (NUDIX family)
MSKEVAVLALVVREDGLILAVSRKFDTSDFGLPGGKMKASETFTQAVKREILEETGYEIEVNSCIYWGIEKGRDVITFDCRVVGGKEGSEEAGVIKWVDWPTLCSGSYADYNLKVMREYETRVDRLGKVS